MLAAAPRGAAGSMWPVLLVHLLVSSSSSSTAVTPGRLQVHDYWARVMTGFSSLDHGRTSDLTHDGSGSVLSHHRPIATIACLKADDSTAIVDVTAHGAKGDGKDCYFLVFMRLFLLILPHTHREIDCYLLDFIGLSPAESPMYAPRNPGLIEKVSPCRQDR
eukprot:SAG31_NODE_16110_length_722_cov_1.229535_1_plen_162_part_00